jgi:hypothetical protein
MRVRRDRSRDRGHHMADYGSLRQVDNVGPNFLFRRPARE